MSAFIISSAVGFSSTKSDNMSSAGANSCINSCELETRKKKNWCDWVEQKGINRWHDPE